jgi:hypothetical protein
MRKTSFWLAVGLVAVVANYAATAAANHLKSPGLSRFVAYAHSSGGA